MEKVTRDGKVAVLYSPGYGAGWYSWNTSYPVLLFDPVLVAAVEAGNLAAVKARAKEIAAAAYLGGAENLMIKWVTEGRRFRIKEYDGSETVIMDDEDDWLTA
ncbi:MAG: hypothetical protein ACK4E3_03480 [Brevundimonas sp.]|uniref:hypothetical protein n=1 Tax=Brevundimonas sp. TaxID=1871086 RepID=UPI00391A4D1B